MFSYDAKKVEKVAIKLHKQFGHPSSQRLIQMIRNSGVKDSKLENKICQISENCETCIKFKKAPPRPVVSIPMANTFNEAISMDLKKFGNVYFLVIVDLFTKYCASAVIHDKKPSTIIENIFRSWISIFGPPKKILSDNGGEFSNDSMREFGETFNIKILNTAAESPWSNGTCERLNAVLGSTVNKIIDETGCKVSIALSWAVSARNALTTYSGYSPNQLVFGYNPAFPNLFQNKLPALSKVDLSEVVRKNLAAMRSARMNFVKIECDAKLQRALASNVRETNSVDVGVGEEVYYKRQDSNEWKGPGVVIGRDGKTIFVKHGGVYLRVHVCRLARVPSGGAQVDSDEEKPSESEKCDVETDRKAVCDCDDDKEREDIESNEDWFEAIDEISQPAEMNVASTSKPSSDPPIVFRSGQRVKGILSDNGGTFSGKIVSRAGKATGAYKHHYNIMSDDDNSIGSYDMRSDFAEIDIVDDNEQLMVFFNSEEVMQAKEREMDNWIENKVFDEVEDEGQVAISVRWVITEKVKDGKTSTKARLVARGFEEETRELRKDSPTCAKETIRLLLALSSSKGWICNSLDIKYAYLQGNNINRELFLKPPPEYNNGQLWKLRKTVYGLCDAARAWYLRVKEELLKTGAEVSREDNGLFYHKKDAILQGLICVHVDDFLWAGNDWFKHNIIGNIAKKFCVGSADTAVFKYVGLHIASSGQMNSSVDQLHYANSIEKISISRARANNKNSDLSEKEKKEYRSLVGQLNWLSTQTRPDIAFDTCLLSGAFSKATVGDLIKLNKLADRVKNQCVKIVFPRLDDMRNCHLACFSDASFANLPGEGSQGGMVILLRDGKGKQCPILWQTRKIRRVVKSTLAAETLALLDCAEEANHLATLIARLLGTQKPPVHCYVDNKSLVDALYSFKLVDGKRLRVEVAALQEMLERRELSKVSWIPTNLQLANCLTKTGASSKELLEAISN